jgi:hypothetical protein
MITRLHVYILALLATRLLAAENLVQNPSFEAGLDQWRSWSRASGALTAAVATADFHGGTKSLRLEHEGTQDWSVEPTQRLSVRPGDLLELECQVKIPEAGTFTLCTSTWDTQGKAVEWSYGARTAQPGAGWQRLRTRVLVPAGIAQIQPRIIGQNSVVGWLDDVKVTRQGNLASLRPANLPEQLTLENPTLSANLNTRDGTLTVAPRPGGRTWVQKPMAGDCLVKNARREGRKLICELFHGGSGLDVTATFSLAGDRPEILVELAAQGELPAALHYPHPFTGQPGDYLVVPMNEGISYPVEDPSIRPMRLIAYGGHGICMAFYGVTDGERGQMAILETPDDAAIRIDRVDNRLAIVPEWQGQHGQFGYGRKVRLVFFESGGHVAMAKRYRAHAREQGLLKTLAEKRQKNPNVDLLMGAVNVWCWDRDSVPLVQEMQAAGIERILWSNQQSPANLRALNELKVLTSRYDIYQDVMAPSNFSRVQWIHPDWTSNAWPQDIILDARGRYLPGWGVETKDGKMVSCGVICDARALPYAQQRVPADLATRPYRSRFIDTTTAAPWNECYHPDHPMTRTDSRKWKMELLRYMSEDNHLVTGCETGHDASVPFLHYFEGMLSLGPYRVPDSGRRMSEIWTNVPGDVAKFQLGHDYRLPLWELVYHDCVVAQWYWGDYNNKLPALWDKRDLFNVLYGVPPMFMFNRAGWQRDKARFVQSYQNTCPHVRRVAYQEMTDHRFLTRDRKVQQTVFANGVSVVVNFGSIPFTLAGGASLPPNGYLISDSGKP